MTLISDEQNTPNERPLSSTEHGDDLLLLADEDEQDDLLLLAEEDDLLLLADEDEEVRRSVNVGELQPETAPKDTLINIEIDEWKVLVVDDDREVHTVTELALADFQFAHTPLRLLSAFSGQEARELLQTHDDIAIILLDIVMESQDAGLQLVRYIRETLKNYLTRIILRTGQPGEAPEQSVIIDYDINDYKLKTELTRRRLLTTVVANLRSYHDLLTIEQYRLQSIKFIAIQHELDVTHRLQQMLLPSPEELAAVDSLDIAGYMEPAEEVGGDYYDVLTHNGSVKISIGDVIDHGLESGVLMLMAQTAVRTLLNRDETDPVRFLDVINRTIYDNAQRMKTDRNLTLALLDYQKNETGGEIRISGQHEEVILIRRNGQVERIDTIDLGFPIGLDAHVAHFTSYTVRALAPGDGVVLFTDGITEAENEAGEHYGLERLCQVAQAHWASSAEVIKTAVIEDVKRYIGQQKIYDDMTLLIAKQR